MLTDFDKIAFAAILGIPGLLLAVLLKINSEPKPTKDKPRLTLEEYRFDAEDYRPLAKTHKPYKYEREVAEKKHKPAMKLIGLAIAFGAFIWVIAQIFVFLFNLDTTVFFTQKQPADDNVPAGYVGIYTVGDLSDIRLNLEGNYILMNDIDIGSAEWLCIGYILKPFTGVFDGNGHKISNLTITIENVNYDTEGLFAYVKNGRIMNLCMLDTNIAILNEGSDVRLLIGSLAGIIDSTIIENCYVSGQISGSLSASKYEPTVGGIVGAAMGNSQIINCSSAVSVTSTTDTQGIAMAGGIVGSLLGFSSIDKCLVTGNITATDNHNDDPYSYAGGICASGFKDKDNSVDNKDNTVSNCVVLSESITGGRRSSLISYFCYNDNNLARTDIKGNATDDSTKRITTVEAKFKITYEVLGWDFVSIWGINPAINNGYPYLSLFHPN